MAAGRPVSMTAAFANLSTTQAGPTKKMAAVADAGAITAYSGTISAFTPPASGAVTVTSAAAGDLTTTANAVAALRGEVNTLNTAVTTLRGEVATLTTKVNSLLAALRTAGALTN